MNHESTYKSAPKTENTAAGKPNAQYDELVLITANNKGATAVIIHPMTTADRHPFINADISILSDHQIG